VKRDYDGAIACFQEAIALDPKLALAHYNLGVALKAKGQFDEAIAECRAALRSKQPFPQAYIAHCCLGNVLRRKGQLDEAIAAYKEAIRLKKDYPEAHTNLGNCLADKGKPDEAIAEYRAALRSKQPFPQAYIAHYCLGNALRRKGQLDKAVAEYRAAVRIKEDFAPAHHNLARLLATCPDPKLRDYPQAVRSAKKAVRLAPGMGACWNTLGVALYRTGAWKEALAALEKSRELSKGGDSWDWFVLAMAYQQLGEKEKARRWYDKAVQWMEKNQPKNEDLRRLRREAAGLLRVAKKSE
jgi:tetratricopeptide (TPR) repeat protein